MPGSRAATAGPGAAGTRRPKHLLDLAAWPVETITALFDTTDVMAQVMTRTIKRVPALQGFTVGTLFFENSTRTRLSFERAARAQTADVISFAAGGSSVTKGESLKDTLRTIDAMQADLYVVRHPASGAPHQLTAWTDAAVVNAGDGRRRTRPRRSSTPTRSRRASPASSASRASSWRSWATSPTRGWRAATSRPGPSWARR